MGLFLFFFSYWLHCGWVSFIQSSKIPVACASLLLYCGWHLLALLVSRSSEIPTKSCLSRSMWPPPAGHWGTGTGTYSMPVTTCTHYLLSGVSLSLRAGYSLTLLTEPLGEWQILQRSWGNYTYVPLYNTEPFQRVFASHSLDHTVHSKTALQFLLASC